MTEKNKKTVQINGKDYNEDELNEEQKILISHIADLERKIGSSQFNLNQLQVGRKAFVDLLITNLEENTKQLETKGK
tara:strand:+ start:28 stop:258 length:231 start_codon:yes stop_codon:yes gene_type:complete